MPVKEVVISGGNPFYNWNYIKNVISTIREKSRHQKITLISNILSFDKEKIELLNQQKVNLIITLTDVEKSIDVNKITRYLKEIGIRYTYNIIENKGSREFFKKIKETFEKNDIRDFNIVEAVDFNDTPVYLDDFNKRKKYCADEIIIQKNKNRCLYGNIAICLNGDVKICPSWNDKIINLKRDKINKVFEDGKISNYWNMSKDNIPVCNKCALKWACNDCMLLLMKLKENNKDGKYICGKQYCIRD